jgi:hypothetical protein
MDGARFDRLARALTPGSARRGVVRGLAGAALGLVLRPDSALTTAKKRKKKKVLKRNAFGCVEVGGKCRGKDSVCCSGICEGKKPKKGKRDRSRCVAHDTGGCQPTGGACELVPNCTTSTGDPSGLCLTTTGQAAYCG